MIADVLPSTDANALRRFALSTIGLPESGKLATIRESLNSLYALHLEIEDPARFQGEWWASKCGDCILTRARVGGTSSMRVLRAAAHLTHEPESFKVVCVREGTLLVRQHGVEVALADDQFLLLSANEPYEYFSRGGSLAFDIVRFPTWLLASRLGHTERFLRHPYSSASGMGAIVVGFMDVLQQRMHEASSLAMAPLTTQLANLVALTLTSKSPQAVHPESSSRVALLERITKFVRKRLANPDLTPALIAAANGISERYLHRIFQDSGQSVCDYIRVQRVAACRRALEDPLQEYRSIAVIGYAHGFRSASQLAKAYRREFGESPSTWRRRASEQRRNVEASKPDTTPARQPARQAR